MTTSQIEVIAADLFKKYGLDQQGWTFGFDSAKRRLGLTTYSLKRITLSKFYAENNPVQTVMNTLLHEIAHALVGQNQGHNTIWRNKALSIGCNGERCTTTNIQHPAKYLITCTLCNANWTAHRLFTKHIETGWHSTCGRKSQGMLKVELNIELNQGVK